MKIKELSATLHHLNPTISFDTGIFVKDLNKPDAMHEQIQIHSGVVRASRQLIKNFQMISLFKERRLSSRRFIVGEMASHAFEVLAFVGTLI